MNAHELDRVKLSLLREIDRSFQRSYHTRLKEIVNDLQMHNASIRPDADADDLISLIDKNKILYFASDPPMQELRATFERLKRGTFGSCEMCGGTIQSETLEKTPTQNLCAFCLTQRQRGPT